MKAKKTYVVGDKVFAKVKGYPAWPAKVESVNKQRYKVLFYGTGETATVKVEDLFSYVDHKQQFVKNLKRKDYIEAVSQIEEALLKEDNVTVEPLDATLTPVTEKKAEKRKRDSIDSDSQTEEHSRKSSTLSKSAGSTPAVTSRSGRQIKVKRYSDEAETFSNKSNASADELSVEEIVDGTPKSSQNSHQKPSSAAKKVKVVRVIPCEELEALIEHGEKMLQNEDLKKVIVRKSQPDKSNVEKIEIVLVKLGNGKLLGIKYKQQGKRAIRNEWERWQRETEWNRAVLVRKQQLEAGEIQAETEPDLYLTDMKMTESEVITATERQVQDRKTRKLHYIQEEAKLIELDRIIKSSLGLEKADTKKALDALKQMSQLSIDELMLKKHPHVLDVMQRLKRYIGNVKEWNLSEAELRDFEAQAEAIRNQSLYLYERFRNFFDIPEEKNFWLVFNERMAEFNSFSKDLSEKQLFALMGEPYSKEAFLHQLDVANKEKAAAADSAGGSEGAEAAVEGAPAAGEREEEQQQEEPKEQQQQEEDDDEDEDEEEPKEKENSSQVANVGHSPAPPEAEAEAESES